ncbi:Uncharacterised protein [Paenibacillus thiaminolyticus]|nr:Uncharacterised protein [Paenibacillus thiaminolyticus]
MGTIFKGHEHSIFYFAQSERIPMKGVRTSVIFVFFSSIHPKTCYNMQLMIDTVHLGWE